ncbi:MAPEG family protein [Falsirhodobacter xinxiangensis]|uniref:MAPEG family protein n=1 Tax=Falsirhodobacter xinxiangensis TaxID=2530049 RepID=UPI0010AB416F|nr:MAPEG family protein [Rhodobacter xinxiangensis]
MTEITVLCLSALLNVAAIGLAGASANKDTGVDYNLSPRDREPGYSVMTGRLRRAQANHAENLFLYAVAVLAVWASGSQGVITATCAWVYLAARVAYIPAYAYGWTPWRSIIFMFGFVATIVMVLTALF